MHVVIAVDSFKGTLSSTRAGRAIAGGIARAQPAIRTTVLAVGDGGEGTLEALLTARRGVKNRVEVAGPLGGPVPAEFAVIEDPREAVLEMASASGLTLVPAELRNPERTSSYGTGELIRAAIKDGCTRITLAVGGSATVDGGAGALQALGVDMIASDGHALREPVTGGDLISIASINLDGLGNLVRNVEFTVLCDVQNPLVGPNGAAAVFGPQKGATPEQVERLAAGLEHWANVLQQATGADVRGRPGAGAAGGLPAGFAAVLGASLLPGAPAVLEQIGFDRYLAQADLVITGEGRVDAQSMMGKVVGTVAERSRRAGVPVIAVGGCRGEGADQCLTVCDALYVVSPECPERLPDAEEAEELLEHCAARSFRDWRSA